MLNSMKSLRLHRSCTVFFFVIEIIRQNMLCKPFYGVFPWSFAG
ncbi:MAG TPA: hypothetical protein DEB17_04165 [Chlorobaculum sp.]|uniref:Uncharacterized protein n=1 Tax=Chlorobaculum tepidum (strain ATCC 49652 / DSM 12025 / NBRC 103806 / TLS) TaxID=194439 RepID=Q8KAD7_CHLTE|nr:hypothetical protein CT2226 [Chlorobaculum tepidum TLS]HBU23179.1 hypothetical protein [Chlorobaculum sp.]